MRKDESSMKHLPGILILWSDINSVKTFLRAMIFGNFYFFFLKNKKKYELKKCYCVSAY